MWALCKHTEGKLELRLDGLCAHLLDFAGEDLSSGGRRVDTVGLDGDEDTTTDFEEPVGVHGNNTGLIRLGNIGKDNIDHGDNHAVAGGLTGILDNGDNIGALRGHGNEVAARAGRELDSVDVTCRANEIGDVGNGGTRGTTNVENAGAWLHVDVVGTTSNGSAQLAAEGVPHAVLNLGGCRSTVVVLDRLVDRDALLAVDGLTGGQVAGSNTVFLTTADNKDTGVTMRLLCSMC